MGSPPPMRGKGRHDFFDFGFQRITPAYAGKRCVLNALHITEWDHPRLCGEKLSFCEFLTHAAGSPPPMRGKGRRLYLPAFRKGITPAYAGKRAPFPQIAASAWDHPRLCGEK